MLLAKEIPHYTYDDYVHWEGRWELIGGHPIAMSPAPIPKHQRIAASLIVEFGTALKSSCKKCKVYTPLDYKIEEDTIVQPDLLIVCGEISKKYLDFSPQLVVEILSPSTAMRDRNAKYKIYQQQSVKYYLIVDADTKRIEIYLLTNGTYTIQSLSENKFDFLLDDDCTIKIDFNEIEWD